MHGQLYFALTALAAAADVADQDACDDLMLEVGVLADLLVRTAPIRSDPVMTSVVFEHWGQLQQSAGERQYQVVAAQAVLLRRMLPVPSRPRGPHDVPPYVPVALRLGEPRRRQLALVTSPDDPVPGDPAAAFLHFLAISLLVGRGHVIDAETGRCPQDCAPPRVGWEAPDRPIGPVVGAFDSAGQALVLDPYRTVHSVRSGSTGDGTIEVARLLVDRWLMDGTLIVDELRVQREPGVLAADAAAFPTSARWVWRIPLLCWAPTQFTGGPGRTRVLRPVPNMAN